MPIGAPLNFTPFVDESIAWADRDALQTFFEDIRVPLSTSTTYGVSLKCASNGFNITPIINVDTFNLVVDGISIGHVPTIQSFVELQNAFIALQNNYKSLLTKL